jgi:hypothetical protein
MTSRTCKVCKVEKDIKNFPINYKTKNMLYYRHKCKECYNKNKRIYSKNYYHTKLKNKN